MFLKKQKKKQQEVTIEENTQIFIEDFKLSGNRLYESYFE